MWLAAAALALLTILTFAQVHRFEFVNYDDFEYVVENPHVSGGLTADNVAWAWRNPYSGTGGPLTWMSHQLDVELFGLSPRGPHVVNLSLHLAAALLLLAALSAMTGATWRSAFVAALFAIHPLHVESVAWVAERKDVLSGFFWFATIAAYIPLREAPADDRLRGGRAVVFRRSVVETDGRYAAFRAALDRRLAARAVAARTGLS